MESGTSVDLEVDRLSSLPDDLIYKILRYVDIIYSMRLSVLSSRWRFIRTSMPTLNFDSSEVYNISSRYHEFVNDVLSARNSKIDVYSVSMQLSLENPELSTERILEYTFSHNVQQLFIIRPRSCYFPPSLLSSKSLKHLTLIDTAIDCRCDSPSWDLPALTTLHLHHVRLLKCSSILAMCQNLKNLTIERCEVWEHKDSGRLRIINSRLVSLTLKKVDWLVDFVYVDTPQLKNLTFVDTPQQKKYCTLELEEYYNYQEFISEFSGELTISAPSLTYLSVKGSYLPKLSLGGFPSLEKVDLCISSPPKIDVHRIHDLFQSLNSVKSLELSLEIFELLATSDEVISHQPSPFPSLKSLKIYPLEGVKTLVLRCLRTYQLPSYLKMFQNQLDEEEEAMKMKLSAEVINYLLGSSSNATFTMVSREEARTVKITTASYRLMAVLWEILEEMEAYTETKRANVEWKKTLSDNCLEDFEMIVSPIGDFKVIFCMLHNIKVLLAKVLASKRVEMQSCFSRLSAKSKTIMNKMIETSFDEIDLSF